MLLFAWDESGNSTLPRRAYRLRDLSQCNTAHCSQEVRSSTQDCHPQRQVLATHALRSALLDCPPHLVSPFADTRVTQTLTPLSAYSARPARLCRSGQCSHDRQSCGPSSGAHRLRTSPSMRTDRRPALARAANPAVRDHTVVPEPRQPVRARFDRLAAPHLRRSDFIEHSLN